MKQIAQSLLEAQKKIRNAQKDAKNPHFRSDYATLESVIGAVKEIANEQGILIIQGTGRDELGDYVNTTLVHAESGESISSKLYLHLDKPTMQAVGSAVSYGRRYILSSLFCITQSDDDANEASKKPQQVTPSNYRIELTGAHFGKLLQDVPPKDLEAYIIHLEKKSKETKLPLIGKGKLFVEMATAFLNQGED